MSTEKFEEAEIGGDFDAAEILNDLRYDNDGNFFLDPAGRLKDKNDPGFFLPKLRPEKERARLIFMSVVNKLLTDTDDEYSFAKETYARLRKEGAGDLEARSLLANCWAEEAQATVATGMPSDDQRLKRSLEALKPYERDSQGRVKR